MTRSMMARAAIPWMAVQVPTRLTVRAAMTPFGAEPETMSCGVTGAMGTVPTHSSLG